LELLLLLQNLGLPLLLQRLLHHLQNLHHWLYQLVYYHLDYLEEGFEEACYLLLHIMLVG
jgi:hypothetical protein